MKLPILLYIFQVELGALPTWSLKIVQVMQNFLEASYEIPTHPTRLLHVFSQSESVNVAPDVQASDSKPF